MSILKFEDCFDSCADNQIKILHFFPLIQILHIEYCKIELFGLNKNIFVEQIITEANKMI